MEEGKEDEVKREKFIEFIEDLNESLKGTYYTVKWNHRSSLEGIVVSIRYDDGIDNLKIFTTVYEDSSDCRVGTILKAIIHHRAHRSFEVGVRQGKRSAQKEIREALGIEEMLRGLSNEQP